MPLLSNVVLLSAVALCVGSFLGVLVLRLPASAPIVVGRSRCIHCGAALGPRDLVPLVSWLILRGRCRTCAAGLGLFYPAIELAALAVALWAAVTVPVGPVLWASCLFGWMLLALGLIDWRHYLLPDVLTLPLIAAGVAVAALNFPEQLPAHLIGAAAGFAVLAVVREIYRRLRGRDGLGLGDAKLLAGIGAWVGWEGLPSVVLGAALLGLVLVVVQAARGRQVVATSQ